MKNKVKTDNETMVFCTMLDSYYLDKGIALINSINRVCQNYVLYLLAFDDRTEEVLKDLNFSNVSIISLRQFETEELLELKKKRTRAEYCWTCKSFLIEYAFDKLNANYCTYIDSDMYFYSSPEVLLDEFVQSGASVGLTKHAFPKTIYGEKLLKMSGKYCAGFNTFKNNEAGRKLLDLWKNQCMEECTIEKCGDQLYLTDWGEKYPEVYDYENPGAGVAPWNLLNYRVRGKFPNFIISNRDIKYNIVFYHFQGIAYSGDGRIKMNMLSWVDNGFVPRSTIRKIYYPYLKEIERIRSFLAGKYDIDINANSGRMEFEQVKFELTKFLKAISDKIKDGNYIGAADLVMRVLRKKQDIVFITRKRRHS